VSHAFGPAGDVAALERRLRNRPKTRAEIVTRDGRILPSRGRRNMNALAAATRSAIADAPEWKERLRDGSVVFIRPIRPADVERERAFLARLSPEYRAYRFIGLIKRPNDSVVRELTCVDAEREVALVALARDRGGETEIGAAHYCASTGGSRCDCAV